MRITILPRRFALCRTGAVKLAAVWGVRVEGTGYPPLCRDCGSGEGPTIAKIRQLRVTRMVLERGLQIIEIAGIESERP